MKPLRPGLHIRRHFADDDIKQTDEIHSIIVVPDDDGSFTSVSRKEIRTIKNKIALTYGKRRKNLDFYFIDPMVEVSIPMMQMMMDIHKIFKYQLLHVNYTPKHPE